MGRPSESGNKKKCTIPATVRQPALYERVRFANNRHYMQVYACAQFQPYSTHFKGGVLFGWRGFLGRRSRPSSPTSRPWGGSQHIEEPRSTLCFPTLCTVIFSWVAVGQPIFNPAGSGIAKPRGSRAVVGYFISPRSAKSRWAHLPQNLLTTHTLRLRWTCCSRQPFWSTQRRSRFWFSQVFLLGRGSGAGAWELHLGRRD